MLPAVADDAPPQAATLVDTDGPGTTRVGPKRERAAFPRRALPERYRDLGRVGKGGSGEVRRVVDLAVDRHVVMKLLAWEHVDPPDNPARRRFENEARVTASLEHPGVVPVHDQGVLADGRPWFTMKEVRGETFAEAIAEMMAQPLATRPAARRALVEALLRVAETVGYAHSRGVVHRDLKPSNLMRGAFGQVYVMDWGVAKADIDGERIAQALATPRPPTEVVPANAPLLETGDRALTRHGDVLGTVPYMAPEQAQGWFEAVGPASDVWALGLVLYEILVGERAFRGPRMRVWIDVARGVVPSLPAGAAVPDELRTLVEAATRPDAAARPPDAERFAARLREWLAGEARRERARDVLREADAHAATLARLRRDEAHERGAAQAILGMLHVNDPDEGRRLEGWRAEDRADAIADAAAHEEAKLLQLLRSALQHDPDHAEAHARMARLAHGEVLAAEARGEPREAKRWERVLTEHDDGTHAAFLAGTGEVALASDPPGAEVRLHRYEEVDRALLARRLDDGVLRTPFRRRLPAGSYLAVLSAPGRALVRYPFTVERAGLWEARPPEGGAPVPVWLPPAEALAPEDCYVPAGWCLLGEPAAPGESYARTRVWTGAFVIRRFPVRLREYLAYLRDLRARGDEEALERALPRSGAGELADLRRTPDRDLRFDEGVSLNPVVLGETPVRYVTPEQAAAYVRWRAEEDALPWRIPSDVEWEKAARGVDARVYPWGRTSAPNWACTVDYDPPGLQSMDAAPRDVGPYGVRHTAGNVHELCATPWRLRPTLDASGRIVDFDPSETRELHTVRGGSYSVELMDRPLSRRLAVPACHPMHNLGFRIVRSLGTTGRDAADRTDLVVG